MILKTYPAPAANLINPIVFGDLVVAPELMALEILVELVVLWMVFHLSYGLLTRHIERLEMLIRSFLTLHLSLNHRAVVI